MTNDESATFQSYAVCWWVNRNDHSYQVQLRWGCKEWHHEMIHLSTLTCVLKKLHACWTYEFLCETNNVIFVPPMFKEHINYIYIYIWCPHEYQTHHTSVTMHIGYHARTYVLATVLDSRHAKGCWNIHSQHFPAWPAVKRWGTDLNGPPPSPSGSQHSASWWDARRTKTWERMTFCDWNTGLSSFWKIPVKWMIWGKNPFQEATKSLDQPWRLHQCVTSGTIFFKSQRTFWYKVVVVSICPQNFIGEA